MIQLTESTVAFALALVGVVGTLVWYGLAWYGLSVLREVRDAVTDDRSTAADGPDP